MTSEEPQWAFVCSGTLDGEKREFDVVAATEAEARACIAAQIPALRDVEIVRVTPIDFWTGEQQ